MRDERADEARRAMRGQFVVRAYGYDCHSSTFATPTAPSCPLPRRLLVLPDLALSRSRRSFAVDELPRARGSGTTLPSPHTVSKQARDGSPKAGCGRGRA